MVQLVECFSLSTVIFTMIRIVTTLLVVSTAAVAAAAPADYESKMQAALDNYAAHSDEILQNAIKEGNDGDAAIDTVEIDAKGDIITSSSDSAKLYAEFGSEAVNAALDQINNVVGEQKVDSSDMYKETFEELTAQNGEGSTTITYGQVEEWEEQGDIMEELKDGEFLSLWQKATGSESQEGEMTLSQFATFNDLLDKLLMAKADFMTVTDGQDTEEGISFDRLWNMDALSDYISEDEFFKLWKKALGGDVVKGVMSYEQFLVFWELASEWLEHDYEKDDESRDEEEDSEDEDSADDEEEEDDEEDYGFVYHGIPAGETGFKFADEDLPEDSRADLESDDEDIRNEAARRRTLDPKMWARFSYWDLHDFFGCEKAFDSPRPLWTDQQWYDVWDLYHEFIEEDKKDGPFTKVRAYQFSKDYMDLSQNAIPFQSGEKGRGLQAVRDIKAGELVFKATNNTIVFNYGHTWRKLLFAVNERDPSITCDMHVWSWVQDLYDGGPMKIVMDLDSGSLLNEGRDNVKGWDPPNVQCGLPDATRCDMDYYAYRDIKKGDELLIDYREFAFLDSWPDMGL
mmetsp:Transcript_12640/g.18802  ORF Transcript_12640/g.18802 Transcript_12640/m.18802 type:complete len:571 (+) Transcript_12640:3-1715(+)